jgi:hypothetical protein
MKRVLIILFGILLTVGISCKKELKETVVDGIVRDFVTGNPLAGVEVYLQMGKDIDANNLYQNPQTFMSSVTGADGKFHFEFKALKRYTYALEYQKPSECYFDYSVGSTINTGETNTIDIKLHSWSTLYIHIKNLTPYDANDQICYCLDKTVATCPFTPIVGMSVDYWDNYSWEAYEKVYIKSFVTKNSILTVKLDSINVIYPCDTLTFNLFY